MNKPPPATTKINPGIARPHLIFIGHDEGMTGRYQTFGIGFVFLKKQEYI